MRLLMFFYSDWGVVNKLTEYGSIDCCVFKNENLPSRLFFDVLNFQRGILYLVFFPPKTVVTH